MIPSFPALPPPQNLVEWSAEILEAYQYLEKLFNRGRSLASLDNLDPVRAQLVVTDIQNQGGDLLQALETELPGEKWVLDCADAIFHLGARLRQSAEVSDGIDRDRLERPTAVTEERSGRPGRPKKRFETATLRDALSMRRTISITTLARALRVHPNTLRKHIRLHGLYQRFSDITDSEIDTLIREFRRMRPKSGLRYAIGFLKGHSIRVPKRRVRASLLRVAPVAQRLRTRAPVSRREYTSVRPNACWHMDGHHKLIAWGIVIHGFVDGYSRKIMGLRASSNNKAQTVLGIFLDSVGQHGFPSRIRGDRGSENVEVSVCMILYRGLNRGSFIWGTSTRNTRIERLWVEVGSQFARAWRAFFSRLERLHRLDRSQHGHLWLLHRLFLPEINEDCRSFQLNWNNHPLSRLGHDKTPEDMFLLGQLRFGKYPEPRDVHPSVQEEYGAGINVRQQISQDLSRHIHHEAVSTPDDHHPFSSDEAISAFDHALEHVIQGGEVPLNFFLCENEWTQSSYPTAETIKVGRKDVDIPLPFEIWYPRAVQWAQGLCIMALVQESTT